MKNNLKSPWYGFVPNLLTLMNLSSGSVAIYFALQYRFEIAIGLMLLAALFDFFDGFAARLLKVSGELGKQLDSLADMVSFGVLPGAIAFSIMNSLIGYQQGFQGSVARTALLLLPLLIPVFSALRLAKFNIDSRQKTGFIGLPTPANALLWASIGWSYSMRPIFAHSPSFWVIGLVFLIVLFSLLMVSNIPMFALKFETFAWKHNRIRYSFLILATLLIILFKLEGIGLSIVLYILFSLLLKDKPKLK
jgi:CDP-diacylglycerol---serine O-phosphatidyltransferase